VPLDTLKTSMMVEGAGGPTMLRNKIRASGVGVLFHGCSGLVGSSFIGHYCWYGTFTALDSKVPAASGSMLSTMCRNAFLGFLSSAVSDTATNSLRVLKTYRQTSATPISYVDAAHSVMAKEGLAGLFGRGLKTRLLSNGVQAACFSATWKYLEKRLAAWKRSDSAK
jgi:hypothetical protein